MTWFDITPFFYFLYNSYLLSVNCNNISSKLPQTSQNNSNLSLIGLALATLGLLGFTITKRKHD